MGIIEQLNIFYENSLSPEECAGGVKRYSKTVEGFVIYGANQVGIEVKRLLREMELNVICFLDDFTEIDQLEGSLVIHSVEEIKRRYHKICFIIASNVQTSKKIMMKKLEQSFSECEILNKEILAYCQWDGLQGTNSDIYLPQICTGITNLCTLKCRGCSAMVSTLPQELKHHYPLGEIKQEVENLGKVIAGTATFGIGGGEPLLHPELAEIIYCVRENINVGQLCIVTNGTLLPSEEVLKAMVECQVIVRVSDYGKLSSKKETLLALLDGRNISAFSRPANAFPWEEFEKMYDRGGDGRRQMENCRDYKCYYLCNGKLYPCLPLSRQEELGLCKLKGEEYIDLKINFDADHARKDLYELSHSTMPFSGCKFCSIERKPIEAGIQLK